jgi:lipid-binding SYLF domain-containing protein
MILQIRNLLVLFFLILASENVFSNAKKETNRIQNSIDVLNAVISVPEKTIPEHFLKHTYGIAIIPGVVKGALGLGGRWGLGIISIHSDSGWSAPVFISLTGGSVGWQFGAQSSDFVLVFRTQRSVENMKKGKFTLGGDVSVAAGPIGRNAEASTDIQLKSEIYSYARSRGLFIGASLEGTSLRIDNKSNEHFYNSKISAQDIFDGKINQVPPIVSDLTSTLEKITHSNPTVESDTTQNQ